MTDVAIQSRLTALRQSHAAGQIDDAMTQARGLLELDDRHKDGHLYLAQALMHLGRPDEARSHLEALCQIDEADPFAPYDLAQIYLAQGLADKALPYALMAVHRRPQNARFYLSAGEALHKTGRTDEAVQVWSLGADIDPALRMLAQRMDAPAPIRAASKLAGEVMCAHLSALHRDMLAAQDETGRLDGSVWPQTHDGPVLYDPPTLHPYMFYVPDLPKVAVFDANDMTGREKLEAAADDIRAEYLSAMADAHEAFKPYIHGDAGLAGDWDKLKGTDNWSSLHLYQDGQRQPAADMFPATLEALSEIPLVRLAGEPMEIFFSVLKPGTHIPPHFGLANTRVTAHLPLIIPDNAAIRVHDQTHVWREGELFIFDDSWDHEAWNRSDETRVVLIFEAWRPDMTQDEIAATEAAFEARQTWMKSRAIPES